MENATKFCTRMFQNGYLNRVKKVSFELGLRRIKTVYTIYKGLTHDNRQQVIDFVSQRLLL